MPLELNDLFDTSPGFVWTQVECGKTINSKFLVVYTQTLRMDGGNLPICENELDHEGSHAARVWVGDGWAGIAWDDALASFPPPFEDEEEWVDSLPDDEFNEKLSRAADRVARREDEEE